MPETENKPNLEEITYAQILKQMDPQGKPIGELQIRSDIDHPAVPFLHTLQELIIHCPGGDTQEGTPLFSMINIAVNAHNHRFTFQPGKQIGADPKEMGPAAKKLWHQIREGQVIIKTAAESEPATISMKNEGDKIAEIILPDIKDNQKTLFFVATSASLILNVPEEAKGKRYSADIDQIHREIDTMLENESARKFFRNIVGFVVNTEYLRNLQELCRKFQDILGYASDEPKYLN